MSTLNTTAFSKVIDEMDNYVSTVLVDIAKKSKELNESLKSRKYLLQTEASKLIVGVTKTAEEWKRLQDDVAKLEDRKATMLEKEAMLGEKERQVALDESKLLELHQALNNKRQVLEEREKKLEERERRARE